MHYLTQLSLNAAKQWRHRSLWLGAALLTGSALCQAGQATQTGAPADDADKEWSEAAVVLPPAPKPEDLIVFYKSSNLSFAIDKASLSTAGDGTVRYTLVSSSTTGAKNISYEAIRCETFEHKLYAFGRSDGTWSRSRRNDWDRISTTGVNKQHYTLYSEFLCEGTTVAGKVPYLINRLQGKVTSQDYAH